MIITVTPNPSLDRTVTLGSPLMRGAVQRVDSVTVEPGGKGINVARALTLAGVAAEAVLPAADSDPFVSALRGLAVPFFGVPISEPVRTNLAITESDGTTTKLNERGAVVDGDALSALTRCVLAKAQGASWVVLSGSLPPGIPAGWYAEIVSLLAPLDCRVAVDTSEAPLAALSSGFDVAAPDLIKPNAEELADLAGASVVELESAAAQGDMSAVVTAASALVARGVGAVLATLGAAGASWWTVQAPGQPRPRRSSRAAPSVRATPHWRVTCAPPSPVPMPPNGCRWPSPTAVPLRPCPDQPCPHPHTSTSTLCVPTP